MSIRFGRSGNGYDSSQVMETADDDWRQVTDLAERRKIQNRLAQRNYRRKLRQRIEDLERQAGECHSTTTSPTALKNRTPSKPRLQKPVYTPPTLNGAVVTGRIGKRRPRTNSARSTTTDREREGSIEEIERSRPDLLDPMSATTLSDSSPLTPGKTYGSHLSHMPLTYYTSDFGPPLTEAPHPISEKNMCWAVGAPKTGNGLSLVVPGRTTLEATIHASTPRGYSPAYVTSTPPGFPELSYSSSCATTSTPALHLDASSSQLPQEHFYMATTTSTLNYNNKLWHAMRVGKIFNVGGEEGSEEGFVEHEPEQDMFVKKEPGFSDDENTKPVQHHHHQYIDNSTPALPYHDDQDNKIPTSMFESWNTWGSEAPWEAGRTATSTTSTSSWEVTDNNLNSFSRDWWRRRHAARVAYWIRALCC